MAILDAACLRPAICCSNIYLFVCCFLLLLLICFFHGRCIPSISIPQGPRRQCNAHAAAAVHCAHGQATYAPPSLLFHVFLFWQIQIVIFKFGHPLLVPTDSFLAPVRSHWSHGKGAGRMVPRAWWLIPAYDVLLLGSQ